MIFCGLFLLVELLGLVSVFPIVTDKSLICVADGSKKEYRSN